MCLSIPYKIKKIKEKKATCDSCQIKNKVIDLGILPEVKVGDWILALNSFAVQRISDKAANELIELLNKGKEV